MILVLYNAEKDEICLYDGSNYIYETWPCNPGGEWRVLEFALKYGWEVIGEL